MARTEKEILEGLEGKTAGEILGEIKQNLEDGKYGEYEREEEVQTNLKKTIFTLIVTIVLCLVAGGVKYYFDHTPTHTTEYKG